jgi:hypothetical protein
MEEAKRWRTSPVNPHMKDKLAGARGAVANSGLTGTEWQCGMVGMAPGAVRRRRERRVERRRATDEWARPCFEFFQ